MLEKASGQVKRVIGGVVQATPVLDLAVNSASERGLLALALHPNFPATPQVLHPLDREQHRRRHQRHGQRPAARQPRRSLHLERLDLTFDRNILMARALQTDNMPVPGQPPARPTLA